MTTQSIWSSGWISGALKYGWRRLGRGSTPQSMRILQSLVDSNVPSDRPRGYPPRRSCVSRTPPRYFCRASFLPVLLQELLPFGLDLPQIGTDLGDGLGRYRRCADHLRGPADLLLDLVEDRALLADDQAGGDRLDGDLSGLVSKKMSVICASSGMISRMPLLHVSGSASNDASGRMATRRLKPWASWRTMSLLEANASMSLV